MVGLTDELSMKEQAKNKLKRFSKGDYVRVGWKNDKKESQHFIIRMVEKDTYSIVTWGTLDLPIGNKLIDFMITEILSSVLIASEKTKLRKINKIEEKILYDM